MTIVTGHEDPAKPESAIDWGWLAASPGTLVILMGLGQLPSITARLIAGGRSPETPAAVIASGTTPEQRVVTASLAELAGAAADAHLASPALVVVGDVVRLRELLAPSAWHGELVAATAPADSRVEPGPALFARIGSSSPEISETRGGHHG